ncbi:MAG: uracil-DNA glycosylase family protein [Hyphomicrobiaceae bacterium]
MGSPLPHEPRPVLQADPRARLLITGQAPGTRVHASGRPFTDPSGDRLRAWLGLSSEAFYDPARVAVVPMGFCFPGLDAKGGDLPPRTECAVHWRAPVLMHLSAIRLAVLVGGYAHRWHIPQRESMADLVRRSFESDLRLDAAGPRMLAIPHPSWRNNGWLKRNAWFEAEAVAALRAQVAQALSG